MRHAIVLGCLVACEPVAPQPAPRPAAIAPSASVPDPRFAAAIRDAARHYTEWGRVDDTVRLAPAPCAAPQMRGDNVSHVRMSAAADGPHGKKLYFLWANQRDAYLNASSFAPGFAIVKQSFAAVPGGAEPAMGEPITTLVTDAGERLSAGAPKDLFVMTKLAVADGTDAGWIYGTVATDGTVTSAGRVASCMACHDHDAAHERLFGLAPAPKF